MSQYSITHKCGHTVTHNIVGTDVHGERGRKADWLASRSCEDCYREEQRQEAAAFSSDLALPALAGSEKQINWATTIRAKIVKDAADFLHEAEVKGQARVAEHPEEEPKLVAFREEAQALYTKLCSQESASWWIDHRGDSGQTALKACR